jgi:hypothetical protein
MKKNINTHGKTIACIGVVMFSLLFISTAMATTSTSTEYQTKIQEKLLYITLSLEFLFIINHKIRSRVSYAFFNNRRGR